MYYTVILCHKLVFHVLVRLIAIEMFNRIAALVVYTGKKRRSSKVTKNNDNDDENVCVDNILDDKLKEESQSLQNGHCHVEMENDEVHDMVSDLPAYGRLRKLSRSKLSAGNKSNGFTVRAMLARY